MRARSNLPAFPLSLSLSRKGRGNVLSKRHSRQTAISSRCIVYHRSSGRFRAAQRAINPLSLLSLREAHNKRGGRGAVLPENARNS